MSLPSSSWRQFKDRDGWIRLLLAIDSGELSPGAKVVGIRLALHHNIETGRLDPSIGMLVAGTGLSESTVRRMIHELESSGWLHVDRTRGRHSNSFELRAPTLSDATGLNPVNGDSVESFNPVSRERVQETSTLSAVTPQPCQGRHPNPVTVDTQKRERKANRKANEIESTQLDLGDEDSGRRNQSPSPDIGADFEQWWAQYPRKVDKGKARAAYRRILAKGDVTSEQLLNGALRYAAERTGQEPRYTKHPTTWLNAEAWNNEAAIPFVDTLTDGAPSPSGYGRHVDEALADAKAAATRRILQ